jgi:hypothetical protein
MAHLVNRVVIHTIHARGFICFVLVVFMIDLDLSLSVGVLWGLTRNDALIIYFL